ncbi:MAG: RelA/SpoT domain-containing protein [Rhodospirillales bacterium]
MDLETYERTGRRAYEDFARAISRILEAAIRTDPALRLQTVAHRAKAVDSLKKKLEDRDLIATVSLEKDIKDLAGCRIIFYTNADVNRFLSSGLMRENFKIIDVKTHYPIRRGNDIRYIADHYVVKLRAERATLHEYTQFTDMRCEIQIQTILNHAWAETAHNITYKKPPLDGFGSAALQAIQQRIDKVMDKYLLPAGHEFHKILSDYERILRGKELFDQGALDAINNSDNNNDRFEALERLADDVLPYYGNLEAEWSQIVDTLARAVEKARSAPPVPRETPFGELPAKTAADITSAVVGILTRFRYLNIERTFFLLCQLFPGAETEDERKMLLGLAEALSKHELEVWKRYGPVAQSILISRIKGLPSDEMEPLQRLLVTMLGEILETEITGTSSSSSAVTFSRGVITASDELAKIRSDAINLLTKIYPLARTDAERGAILGTLHAATSLPDGDKSSHELVHIILKQSRSIIDFYTNISPKLSWEILQSREQQVLYLYHNSRELPDDMETDPALRDARDDLLASIRAFRDEANRDRQFDIYKTLVGFESVFPPAWENEEFDYEQEAAYREVRVAQLVDDVDDANADEWFTILTRCAQTQSSDLATFPAFGSFLRRLGETKSDVLIGYLDRMDDNLARFLPAILRGLMKSPRRDHVLAKVDQWVELGRYLSDIAWYLRSSEPFDGRLLQRVLEQSLALGEDDAVLNSLLAVADQHKNHSGTLIKGVFLPALRYLAAKSDMRWIGLTWLQWRTNSLAEALEADEAKEILATLVSLPGIDTKVEPIIASICVRWPEKVIDFLGERQEIKLSVSKRYRALPFSVHQLQEPLAAASDILIAAARRWFDDDSVRFRYQGGHFLAAVLPDFSSDVYEQLAARVRSGDRHEITFVIEILHNYEGKPFIHDLCKEVIAILDEKDELLTEMLGVLCNIGTTCGDYGSAEALAERRSAIDKWRNDPRERVRTFATECIHTLDQWIADEHRSAEESIALRKLNYGEDISSTG